MEFIIGLLFILLPAAFTLIGKNLEKAATPEGDAPPKEHAEDWLETIRRHLEAQQNAVEPEEPKVPVVVEERPNTSEEQAPQVKTVPTVLDEQPEKVSEKIDPKKLVIYSEIMKPKYQE